jgi:very-short-patch-repair endonuclease
VEEGPVPKVNLYEEAFARLMRENGLDEGMARQYLFAQPRRKFRADFAWPARLVYVEIDGGTWSRGRHVRGAGFARDCEKLNLATVLGWRGLRFTPGMIGGAAVETVRAALAWQGGE